MYQRKYNVAPTSANDPITALLATLKKSGKDRDSAGEGSNEIDFGADEGIDFGGEEAIDFGDGGDEKIDFGDDKIDFGDDWAGADITVEGASDQIDFGDWKVSDADIAAAKQVRKRLYY